MYEVVMDTGGTFTDAVLLDEDRNITMAKYPTDPFTPSVGIMGCMKNLAMQLGCTVQEMLHRTTSVVIGTTLPTNTVVEGKGAKCCLLHTKGFRDIPELGRRLPKEDIYNLKVPAPKPPIPRHLRFAVEERVQFNGQEVTPLNTNDVQRAIEEAKRLGVEVPVVCFLHSYINPEHEEQAGEIIKKEYPNVVLSTHILRRWMEWDRLSTAMIAGAVKPVVARFLGNLDQELKSNKFQGTLLLTTCLGGVASPELYLDNPALAIGSGPAAGPLLGRFLAELSNFENVIVLDMGGTTCDVSLLPHKKIEISPEMRVGDFVNALESVDVPSIGAGGGSIAAIDDRGILHVGPESSGANPGPACYVRGGTKPTVTDADVVLGYVPTDYFLGGRMVLNAELARKAIIEHVATPLRMGLEEAAHAIASIVEENMAQGIFLSAVQKGLDPRDFTLVLGGGAGAVHGVAVAERLGIQQLYVPKQASAFCALGAALANYEYVLNRCIYRREDDLSIDNLKSWFAGLEQEGLEMLARQGLAEREMRFVRGAEMRYFGQLRDIVVYLPENRRGDPATEQTLKDLIAQFHAIHQAMYGWSDASMAVTLSTLKLKAVGLRRPIELRSRPYQGKDSSAALKRKRNVYFKELGGFVSTPCYDAERLKHGNEIAGPAIVEHPATTVVLPNDTTLVVDAYENYLIRRAQ
jgi:N-methylhydantoinase A